MSLTFTRASVKGPKGQQDVSIASMDPSIFFTILPAEILFEMGASSQSLRAELELEGGSSVEAPIYSVLVSAGGRENATLDATYKGAVPLLGAKFLKDFGLKVDAESGSWEPTRHPGLAYDFEP